MAGAVTVGATLRAGWPVLVIPSAINMPIFLLLALMHEPGEPLLDAAWTGIVTGERRVYTAGAYRAVFGLCLAVAVGAVALAACVTETRCRNVWTSG